MNINESVFLQVFFQKIRGKLARTRLASAFFPGSDGTFPHEEVVDLGESVQLLAHEFQGMRSQGMLQDVTFFYLTGMFLVTSSFGRCKLKSCQFLLLCKLCLKDLSV